LKQVKFLKVDIDNRALEAVVQDHGITGVVSNPQRFVESSTVAVLYWGVEQRCQEGGAKLADRISGIVLHLYHAE